MPPADVEPAVPLTSAEIIRRLRVQVRDLKIEQARLEERHREADRQRTKQHVEIQRLQAKVIHQTARASYYVSAYYVVVPAAQRVPTYSQYMAASEGARAPRAEKIPDASPPPPPDAEEHADN